MRQVERYNSFVFFYRYLHSNKTNLNVWQELWCCDTIVSHFLLPMLLNFGHLIRMCSAVSSTFCLHSSHSLCHKTVRRVGFCFDDSLGYCVNLGLCSWLPYLPRLLQWWSFWTSLTFISVILSILVIVCAYKFVSL